MPAKLDFRKEFPAYYAAAPEPHLEHFGSVPYLAIDGRGPPGGPAFRAAVGALYAVAYGAKFRAKAHGADFGVPALEAQWWTGTKQGLDKVPKAKWHWRLLVRVPPALGRGDIAAAIAGAKAKGHPQADQVSLAWLDEGDCLQALHVGPYGKEGATVRRIAQHAAQAGLHLAGPHHEIYLNDPSRVAPSRLKTILRWPVAAA